MSDWSHWFLLGCIVILAFCVGVLERAYNKQTAYISELQLRIIVLLNKLTEIRDE